MSNLLKQSLYDLYRNEHHILDLLDQCDLSFVSSRFNKELYARLDKESCDKAQEMLMSDVVKAYDVAIQAATLAITRDLADLLDLVLTPQGDGRSH